MYFIFSTCSRYKVNHKLSQNQIWDMWQSWTEIEYYSVAYFEHITEFDAL